jgi:hypothetical protein
MLELKKGIVMKETIIFTLFIGLLIGCENESDYMDGEGDSANQSDENGYSESVAESGLSMETIERLETEISQFLVKHPEAVRAPDHDYAVSWADGKVVLDFANGLMPDNEVSDVEISDDGIATTKSALTKKKAHGCCSGCYCLYQEKKWGGRKLSFSDCSFGGYKNSLSDYDFANKASSWVNNDWGITAYAAAYDNKSGRLWKMDHQSLSKSVSKSHDNKADYLKCFLL